MTPFEAALSSFLPAAASALAAASLSPAATDSRTLRTYVLRSDFTALLRSRDFSLVPMRLIWDLMLATCVLPGAVWAGRRGRARFRDWGVGTPSERHRAGARRPGRTREE